jgi:hypothetical protein
MNTSTINHNKKRNVGVIYELLLRSVSAYLVEGDKTKAQTALDIVSKSFSRDSELFKEFRLFNALAKTRITDSASIAVIITESKAATRRIDYQKLDREKSLLIRDINHKLNDPLFYHRRIANYRELATIQTALNEWSLGDRSDFSKTLMIETKIVEILKSDPAVEQPANEQKDVKVDSLVVKILNEKFNKKYAGALSEDQREMIRDYVIMNTSDGPSEEMIKRARRLKEESIKTLNVIEKTEPNRIIQESLKDVRTRVASLDLTTLDDDKLGKLMTLSQLIEEAKETK